MNPQVPLVLAWALSVHKCQGMTLDYVETDLSKAFGCGMVYVALSRVKSLEGLHLLGFDPSRIKTDPLVVKFYQELAVRQAQQLDCEYYEGDYKEEDNNGERGDP
jgi:ATP-dependent DNA helicase PIF1